MTDRRRQTTRNTDIQTKWKYTNWLSRPPNSYVFKARADGNQPASTISLQKPLTTTTTTVKIDEHDAAIKRIQYCNVHAATPWTYPMVSVSFRIWRKGCSGCLGDVLTCVTVSVGGETSSDSCVVLSVWDRVTRPPSVRLAHATRDCFFFVLLLLVVRAMVDGKWWKQVVVEYNCQNCVCCDFHALDFMR